MKKPNSKIRLICAPYGNAGRIRGTEQGAEILSKLAANALGIPYSIIAAEESPNLQGPACSAEVAKYCSRLKGSVAEVLKNNCMPLTIGGDHSISLGSISGALDSVQDDLCVIYIDAHGDINTLETSPSGNVHGMTLAAAMGIGINELTAVPKRKLRPENLLYIGVRSLDPGEVDLIEKLNISTISSDYINTHEIGLTLNTISKFLAYHDHLPIHISFDIDALDPEVAPATGVPEPNGLTEKTVLDILNYIFSIGRVVSMDIVEYNPVLDNNEVTYCLLSRIFKSMNL